MKARIKKFKAAAAAKLKSQAGDTFIEVLAAGLIIILGIAMAVAMIGTSSRLVMKSDKIQNSYYEQRNIIEKTDNTSLNPADITINVSLQVNESSAQTIPITVYTFTDTVTGQPILSYFVKR